MSSSCFNRHRRHVFSWLLIGLGRHEAEHLLKLRQHIQIAYPPEMVGIDQLSHPLIDILWLSLVHGWFLPNGRSLAVQPVLVRRPCPERLIPCLPALVFSPA